MFPPSHNVEFNLQALSGVAGYVPTFTLNSFGRNCSQRLLQQFRINCLLDRRL